MDNLRAVSSTQSRRRSLVVHWFGSQVTAAVDQIDPASRKPLIIGRSNQCRVNSGTTISFLQEKSW
jgi:hypothetical protein